MSRLRIIARALGAPLLALLCLLLPAISRALPAGAPPLSPERRAALSRAAEGRALLPWQRHVMRGLAAAAAAPAKTAGADGSWNELPPPQLEEVTGVYDRVRQSMLVFGGHLSNGGGFSNDLWELSLSGSPTWTLLSTTGPKPSPRRSHVLLFDSRREQLVLFAGADSMTHNDFWTLDLSSEPFSWAQGFPTGTPPSRRGYCQAVYDSLNDRMVVFGGADSLPQNGPPTGMNADLWVLPFTGPLAWSQLTPTPAESPPSARAAGAVIYDRSRQRMVLFGGYDGAPLADGFTLSLGATPAWAPLGASGGPPPARAVPGVIYDPAQDRMLIFGGYTGGSANDVWELDLAAPAWTELLPTGGPPSPRQQPVAVFDAPRDRMVVFSGNDNNGHPADPLWSLSLGPTLAWTDLGEHHPPQRWDAATVVDPTRQVMWVQGGRGWDSNVGQVARTDLWSLPLSSASDWTEAVPTGTPLGRRYGHSAVYDALRDRLVFFGGSDTTFILNDVKVLTLSGTPAWSSLSPSGTPPAGRLYHSAVYDAVHDRMIVFGGWTGTSTLNDVWALTFAPGPAWTQLFPTGTPPPPRYGQSAALDYDANRLIVFGGGLSNDVYALTLNGSPAWTQLAPTGTPPAPRQSAAMVSLGTRMLVFGGDTFNSGWGASNDSWLLSLYPTPSWRPLDVGPLYPGGRQGAAAGFDPATFRLAIFGGTGGNGTTSDTWFLPLNQVVPTLASLVSATAEHGRVELVWSLASSRGSATVYRSLEGGAWSALGSVVPNGTGRISYVDTDVIAGSRYGYRLGLPGNGREVFVAEVWVNVPVTARFALRGMTPNPGPAGEGLVAFSLPDGAPARLEVMDVTGRRVFAREVGGMGAGEHFVRVGGAEPLPPGVYLVRLTRGGRALTAKGVSIR